ncbi:MAG: hypothetical protein JWR67_3678 [Mucilaginibacter sp.]|nr:hypothetical protein [Mucilaginibacter sp.]
MAGCSHEKKTPVSQADVKKPALMNPFKFHKLIEVSPGQYYDILSWGRGSVDTGAFLILHSDSSGKKYNTTTGDLYGTITDVYNTDMDVDGNPEILVQAKKKDTVNYTTIYAFEFKDNKAQKLDFPKLTGSQKKGYRGNDNFYIEEGKLIREFPVYDGNGKEAKQTTQKRKLEYGLRNNNFTVKQLSKDSTNKAAVKPVAQETVKKAEPDKKQSESKKQHKKTHHRKHRHSD